MKNILGYDAVFVGNTFLNCTSCICIEVYELVFYDVVICIKRDSDVVLCVSDVGFDAFNLFSFYLGVVSEEFSAEKSVVYSRSDRPPGA